MDSLIVLVVHYRYAILLPLAFFEGPIMAFIMGTLMPLGYFNLALVYVILIFGDLIPDAVYFFLGRYGEKKMLIRKYSAKIGITENHFDTIRHLWEHHPAKTMLFSKLAYGLSTPFLISAGLVGMKFKKFISYSLPVSIVLYGLLLALGYYFSNSFDIVSRSVEGVQLVIAAIAVFAILYYFFTRYMGKKLLNEEKKEERGEAKD